MSDLGMKAVEMLRSNILDKGLNASGRTAKSIDFIDEGDRFILYSDMTGAPISTLQYGREGGKVPYGFVGIIKQWIVDKGVPTTAMPYKRQPSAKWQPKYTPDERGKLAAAGAIAHKIQKEGTERHKNNRDDIYTPVQDFVIEEMKKRTKDLLINELLK